MQDSGGALNMISEPLNQIVLFGRNDCKEHLCDRECWFGSELNIGEKSLTCHSLPR